MSDRDVLKRIDQHMARGNELMEQNRLAFERNRAAHEDLRVFIRDITRRNEGVWREVLRELRGLRTETRAEGQAQRAILYDIVDENRAQREGLLRVLDELRRQGPGGKGATA